MARQHTTTSNSLNDSTYNGPSGQTSWTLAFYYDPDQASAADHQNNYGGGQFLSELVRWGSPGTDSVYVWWGNFGSGDLLALFDETTSAEPIFTVTVGDGPHRWCFRHDAGSTRLWRDGVEVSTAVSTATIDSVVTATGLTLAQNQVAKIGDVAFDHSAWSVAQCAAATSTSAPAYPSGAITYGRAFNTSAGTEYATDVTTGVTETGGTYSAHTPIATPLNLQTIAPPVLARSRSIYQPSIALSALSVVLPSVARSRALFAPSVTASGALTLPTVSRARSVFAPSVAPGSISVSTPSVTRSRTLFAPTVSVGASTIIAPHVTRARILFAPAVSSVATLAPPLFARSRVIHAPSVVPGGAALTLPAVARSRVIYGLAVNTVGTQTVAPPVFARSRNTYAPVIVPAASTEVILTSIYDFNVDPDANAAQSPDGFARGVFQAKTVNNIMREFQAKLARFHVDASHVSGVSAAGPDGIGADLRVTLNQTSTPNPPPNGFLVGFRMPHLSTNPQWLSVDAGVTYRPLIPARGNAFAPGGLKGGALYAAVYYDGVWQLHSNVKGSRVAPTLRTETDSANLTIRATDIGNTIEFVSTGIESIVLTISDAVSQRWPVGASVELLNRGYKTSVAVSIPNGTVFTDASAVGDGTLNIGFEATNFNHGRILRQSATVFRLVSNPRLVP